MSDIKFISGEYKKSPELRKFFRQVLAVRKANAYDLKEALLALPCQLEEQFLPEDSVRHIALQIYTGLAAGNPATLDWLSDLLSNHPVLLVEDGQQLRFESASSGHPIYLADDSRLAQLFAAHCRMLAVKPEQLPLLAQLLQQVAPPLQNLSQSVRREYVAAGGGGGVLSDHWTGLLQAVLRLILRVVYKQRPQDFMEVQLSKVMQQLCNLQQKLPGFDETCWRSSARQYWPGSDTPLQPPAVELSYDFLYEDVDGVLSGAPGTLCCIECKATRFDAASDGSGVSTHEFPITTNEWRLAQEVRQQSTPQQPALYVVMCVDRVWQEGGPRLVAQLWDPVGLLQQSLLWVTGQELRLCSFPVCRDGDSCADV
ncbi:hypothetical protein OEZ85_012958 [Tetradesmus obliquus]|uniref:Protein NO VEIN C-terminal domain-containing protein n=1 Tax=Tetradesmus obliquus TaxID=3088 RepID=A0ABY8U762_TETOB|nr:hypothetical protein OEZ85_012958 [Tetradesmus obliquus]